ncbi:hypothetical protein [Parendozoicomonas sp. Alg238-R29]|uniref:hypothetical protein n=1 Tax=Parendozoicomonas sp. Alg238-R29 TaxID=2993446 RepID=UPI00248D3BD0|nr:hypothetical protein [Parendozoicomonas sp. Alg238-R29]
MNPQTRQAIVSHLTTQQLSPEEQQAEDPAISWVFNIAEDLQSELFCYEQEVGDLTAIMLTSVKITPNDNATTLAAALSPALAPASIVMMNDVLTLRLMLRGDANSIGGLLDEGILISRHIISAVFTRIVDLAASKIPMQQAMVTAMQALQGPGAEQDQQAPAQ